MTKIKKNNFFVLPLLTLGIEKNASLCSRLDLTEYKKKDCTSIMKYFSWHLTVNKFQNVILMTIGTAVLFFAFFK